VTRNIDHGRLGRVRQGQGEIINHIIDELAAGRLSRRDFIRRASVVGISAPLLGSILAACSSSSLTEIFGAGSSSTPSSSSSATSASARGKAGAVIKAGIITPTGAINPLTLADQGGLDMLAQTGEYLCLCGQTLNLQPVLATSWSPNSKADVWTFKIRQGVKFHNGAPLTADDVVYTYRLHTSPKNGSSALDNFAGVLSPSGVVKVDDYTAAFHLEAPNGNFPYLTSSDNYNMIILPKGYDPTKWQSSFTGTGPFVMKSYTPKVGPRSPATSRTGASRRCRPRPSSPSTTPSPRRS
jgi:peptide/nickel transport system substrate-binding protein